MIYTGGIVRFLIVLIFTLPLAVHAQVLTDGNNTTGTGLRTPPPVQNQQQVNNNNQAFDAGEDNELRNDDQFSDGFNSGGNRINADQSRDDSSSVQALGLAMGAMFSAICPTPGGSWACAPAALSFLDALRAGNNGGSSVGFSNALQTNGGLNGADTTTLQAGNQEAEAQLRELEGQGVLVNRETGAVTTPDGQTLSGTDFSSQQALEAKGFTPEQAASIMDKLNEIQAAAVKKAPDKKKQLASTTTGGGDSGAGSDAEASAGEIVFEDEDDGKAKVAKTDKDRLPANEAAKLSKNFNGSPIGIGLADIFLIVKKKYEKEDSRNAFFKREY